MGRRYGSVEASETDAMRPWATRSLVALTVLLLCAFGGRAVDGGASTTLARLFRRDPDTSVARYETATVTPLQLTGTSSPRTSSALRGAA